MGNCAGIDWASEKHDVLIEDPAGRELLGATFAHDEDSDQRLCAALPVNEQPLLDAGIPVLALHPNQVKAASTFAGGRRRPRCCS